MGLQNKKTQGKFLMFALGILLAFGFICAMQFISAKENMLMFALALFGMHGGVICFILSKKIFKLDCDAGLKKHYTVEYGLLALYLPVMLLKVVGIKIPESLSVIIILAITVFAIAVSVMNCKKLYLKLKDQA